MSQLTFSGNRLGILLLLVTMATAAKAQGPEQILAWVEQYPHTESAASSVEDVQDLEIGLGALQKVRSQWEFKDSERVTGELQRNTWRLASGFSSAELFEELSQKAEQLAGSELLFACSGRACGHGAQWANRVFGQRILYGRDDQQRYSIYRVEEDERYRLLMYSSVRSTSRQYLHIDLIRLADPE
ncbi:MAG: DUF4892 domain-containing protein [Halioglobus sp.]